MAEDFQKQFERFGREIDRHAVTVLRDDGLYRHLRCARGTSYMCSFDIITWPGYLCYSGDMGCYVFTRLADMFEFFRGKREAVIDRGYLAEKAVAADKHSAITAYSEDRFIAAVKSDYEQYAESLDEDERRDLWRDVEMDVLSAVGDGRAAAVEAAMGFTYQGAHVFTDFWEHRLEEYTTRFWWCCYAIPWAIEQYDALRQAALRGETTRLETPPEAV
jgi:hypothetical protein